MTTIKEFDTKLKSLKNTRKITKTMKMVSASKLRRAHQAQANAKFYARQLTAMTSRISASVSSASHPLLMSRKEFRNVIILIITSDKGLCGAFNHNANRRVAAWIRENRPLHEKIELWCCGKKGFMYFERHDMVNPSTSLRIDSERRRPEGGLGAGERVKIHYENVTLAPRFEDAVKIGNDLSTAFREGRYDAAYLSYNQFINPLVQKTVFEQILPVDPHLVAARTDHHPDYIFEPDIQTVLDFLIPHFLYFKIYFSLLENSAGEHGARMTAMDSATKNASEMIDRYTLSRNRARQAAITTELTEIIGGAEVLK